MAMVVATLQADFLAAFLAMNSMDSGGNAYCAEKVAEAIKKYILTGQTSTTDSGAAPGGPYAGSGQGTMTIDDGQLKSDLQATYEAGYDNDTQAAHIATNIDDACTAADTVQETSRGTVTPPSGTPFSFSGPAKGEFSGDKSKIEDPLKSCFSTMNSMNSGGNQLYAAQFAIAVDAYLKAGNISVTLQAPFVSGSGSGKIT